MFYHSLKFCPNLKITSYFNLSPFLIILHFEFLKLFKNFKILSKPPGTGRPELATGLTPDEVPKCTLSHPVGWSKLHEPVDRIGSTGRSPVDGAKMHSLSSSRVCSTGWRKVRPVDPLLKYNLDRSLPLCFPIHGSI